MNRHFLKMAAAMLLSLTAVAASAETIIAAIKPLAQSHILDFSAQSAPSVVIPVSTAGNVTVVVMTGAPLALTLRRPDGIVIDEANASQFGASFQRFTASNGYEQLLVPTASTLISMPGAVAGDYVLSASGGTGLGKVMVRVDGASGGVRSSLVVGTGPTAELDKRIPVTLALFDNAQPVTNASVDASVIDATGSGLVRLSLADDGRASDVQAGDGLYSGYFDPPAAGGYSVSATISGQDNHGVSFVGYDGGRIVVIDPDIRLTGAFTDEGIDRNGNGFFDVVRFELAQEGVRGPGNYDVHVELVASNDLRTTAAARISNPSDALAVEFSAEQLKRLGVDGPYQVSYAIVIHDQVPLRRWDNLGSTSPYTIASLERGNTVLHPLHAATTVDLDGDGLFDRLDVKFDADLLIAGYYGVSADLRSADGKLLDEAGESQLYLARGHNEVTLRFSGEKIGQGGVDGPYYFSNVLLYPLFNAPAAALSDDMGETEAFRCDQFAGCGGNLAMQFARLLSQIEALPLNKGLKQSLAVKLRGAQAELAKDHHNSPKAAANKIKAFINEIRAQRDVHVPRKDADLLIDGASLILHIIEA